MHGDIFLREGEAKMPRCEQEIWHGFHSHRCENEGKYEADGRWYCGVHNPNRPETKAQMRAGIRNDMDSARIEMQRELMRSCRCIQEARGVDVDEHVRAIVQILDRFDNRISQLRGALEQLEGG